MKKIIVILAASLIGLTGCDLYTNNIASKSKDTLQSNLDSDTKFAKYKMRVVDVQLVSESMSKYEGIAKIDFEGKIYDVPVSVSADSSNIFVQTKPGGFMFLIEKEIKEGIEKFEKDMAESTKDLEIKLEALKEKYK
jgi:hypothetical protein